MKLFSKALVATFAVANIATVIPSYAAMGTTVLPPEKTEAGIVYRTGGVGKDEIAAFKKIESQYPLVMEFLGKPAEDGMHAEYLAGIKVTIAKEQGTKPMLSTTATGPFLMAKLAPGKYKVTAEYGGKAHTRTVEVHAKRTERIVFEWKA
jgi:hypothetical protein